MRINPLFWLLFILGVTVCIPAFSAKPPTEAETLSFLGTYQDAYNQRSQEKLRQLLAPEYLWEGYRWRQFSQLNSAQYLQQWSKQIQDIPYYKLQLSLENIEFIGLRAIAHLNRHEELGTDATHAKLFNQPETAILEKHGDQIFLVKTAVLKRGYF